MRRAAMLSALLVSAVFSQPARAEVITFLGKTFSPNHMEVYSPHATPVEMKIFENMAKELKEKRGEDVEPPIKPFTGRMKVLKMMADIGHKVDLEQRLLEYAFPPEDLLSEKRKLSRADIKNLESSLERARATITSLRGRLDEARLRHSKGMASNQEIQDLGRELELLRGREAILQENLRLEKEMAAGELEIAKSKFGLKASPEYLPGISWLVSPVAGHVLWVNPEVKPGVILTKKTRLFVVGSMDPLVVRALVHEITLPRLKPGDKAQVTFETAPGRVYEATLTRIQQTGAWSDVQLPSHFEVELTLANPDLALKQGMRGQVSITVPDGPRT